MFSGGNKNFIQKKRETLLQLIDNLLLFFLMIKHIILHFLDYNAAYISDSFF